MVFIQLICRESVEKRNQRDQTEISLQPNHIFLYRVSRCLLRTFGNFDNVYHFLLQLRENNFQWIWDRLYQKVPLMLVDTPSLNVRVDSESCTWDQGMQFQSLSTLCKRAHQQTVPASYSIAFTCGSRTFLLLREMCEGICFCSV